jgi:SNF2 family DNA or RNA helicase
MKELPPKKELILRVELTTKQKEYYRAILTKNYEVLARRSGAQVTTPFDFLISAHICLYWVYDSLLLVTDIPNKRCNGVAQTLLPWIHDR